MKVKVRLEAQHHILIHNDLANAAYRFKTTVEERLAKDDREGLSLEIMAALTFMAFTSEARFNFLGFKLVKGWNEGANALDKVNLVCTTLGVNNDFAARPYMTLKQVQKFRNTLAHGKPKERLIDTTIVASEDELEGLGVIEAPEWETFVNAEFMAQAHDDLNQIWKDLLGAAKLTIFETLTRGQVSTSFIEKVDDGS